ncbi:MAG: hypothetical protein RQ867_00745, partial [Mariprofundaceae bacterium]|nr:hypothetical protein [Mariprofundaceae bacterium]
MDDPWKSPTGEPRITIRQDSRVGRTSGRPKGEGHGCLESQSGRTAGLDGLQAARRVKATDASNH